MGYGAGYGIRNAKMSSTYGCLLIRIRSLIADLLMEKELRTPISDECFGF